MSTVSKVRTLFAKLNKNGGSAEQDMYSAWLRFVNESERQIEAFYQDDGEPAITVFRGENNVPVCMYRWVPPNTVSPGFKKAEGVRLPSTVAPSKASYHMSVSTSTSFVRSSSTEYEQSEDWHNIDWTRIKGAVFFSHGITESCRFSLLNLREMETCAALQHTKELNESERQTLVKLACSDEGCVQQFRNGWADAIVSAGYVLYAIDMQGHGLSQAWRNSRCNVENFCHYILDTLTVSRFSSHSITPFLQTSAHFHNSCHCLCVNTVSFPYFFISFSQVCLVVVWLVSFSCRSDSPLLAGN
eukprot:Gregarina_sp_Poly_1__1878@NODE_148_length_12732_cov_224_057008_g87_i1_p7_GENE_NODE_148_length_12732_cov_224_057008_g87_i1NODE_148_length_12732_cov_224_057008_g87_i1_p7_ORF_typecomplete_len301_score23_19Hydrolase_4/PF12146_8/2_4e02Hydrolase_4/PF12146_8/3_1e05Abhydrolase_1/PF00561_20/4_2e03Abhydrolase_1/PF00561_20/0_21Abhydrolase_7/PF12715_7/0_23_NODE_148_length_12732_cov_224_057008_g87_i148675769